MIVSNGCMPEAAQQLRSSVLKLISRFVLQVLPYLLMALAAVVVLPGVADSLIRAALPAASSSPSDARMIVEPFGYGETTVDLIDQDHEAFAASRFLTEIIKAADAGLERH
jgi:hypothetical protein